MSRQIITANRLRDGAVVYLTPEGLWSESLDGARVAGSRDEVERLLAGAERAVADRIIVDVYAFPVADEGRGGAPVADAREDPRRRAPTTHPAFARNPGPARADDDRRRAPAARNGCHVPL